MIFRVTAAAVAFLVSVASENGFGNSEKPPRFEDFPVNTSYNGTLAAPKFVRPEERRYRTAIGNGVTKGYGVRENGEGAERRGPKFAGRYIVVQWGCGTECFLYAIIDAVTGRIIQPPVAGKRMAHFDSGYLVFRLRSRLMIVKTNCVMGNSERCARDYFVWQSNRFSFLYHRRRTAF